MLDKKSNIKKVKPSERHSVTYNPITLQQISMKLKDETAHGPSEGIYVDIIAIPDKDYGQGSDRGPRKIRLIDKTETNVIMTLWGKDAKKDKAIETILYKPILIR